MRRHRHAKIVATLGPASSSREVIQALFDAGTDVFRFNFSHGSHEDHRERLNIVRDIEARTGRPIAVLADLQGPKLRLGTMAEGPFVIEEGASIRLDLDPTPGNRDRVPLPHPEIFAALSPGVHLLVDDGKVRLEIEQAEAESATARVLTGGRISERKGVSVVGAVLPVSPLTEKDRRDLTFALELGVDWVALSFVQRPEDMDELRELVGGKAAIMAKLEKPSAIDRLEEIVDRSDAVMVARGDLGVEMQPEQVPTIQRRVLRAGRNAGKPVMVATQMLESMIEAPTPTRAEASDVATAVYEGADAVMLSAESAAGRYPLEAVRMMDRIIAEVERDPLLPHGDRCGPSGAGADHLGCDLLRHALGGGAAAGGGDRDTHDIGLDSAPGGARTARRTDPEPDARHVHRAPAGARLGCSCRADQRDGTGVRDRGIRLRHRRRAKDWPSPAKSS